MITNPFVKKARVCYIFCVSKKYSADFSSNFDDHRNFLMSLLRQQELRKKCNFFPLLLLGRVEARSNGSFWEIAGQVA